MQLKQQEKESRTRPATRLTLAQGSLKRVTVSADPKSCTQRKSRCAAAREYLKSSKKFDTSNTSFTHLLPISQDLLLLLSRQNEAKILPRHPKQLSTPDNRKCELQRHYLTSASFADKAEAQQVQACSESPQTRMLRVHKDLKQ